MQTTGVVIGMSGGVDSSVAAHRLTVRGYRVIGLTIRFLSGGSADAQHGDGGEEAVQRAGDVCRKLGIEHHVIDASMLFDESVVERFVDEYRSGATPNPCITCNEKVKFPLLAKFADEMGCSSIATGHYARLVRVDSGKIYLSAAHDRSKDQSYFLYRVPVSLLERSIFPLGGMEKQAVSREAQRLGLGSADGRESQDVCFFPAGGLSSFLTGRGVGGCGDVIDAGGRVVGRHRGISHYTLGQRKGLGIAGKEPQYVISIDPARNLVVLGPEDHLYGSVVSCRGARLRVRRLEGPLFAKIRSGHEPAPVLSVERGHGGFTVRFHERQRAITPGQSLVLYRRGLVVGGGIIRSVGDR